MIVYDQTKTPDRHDPAHQYVIDCYKCGSEQLRPARPEELTVVEIHSIMWRFVVCADCGQMTQLPYWWAPV